MNDHPLERAFSNDLADDLPGIGKKAMCASGRSAIHFGRLSRVDRPSDALVRWRGGSFLQENPEKNKKPSPPTPPFLVAGTGTWRGGGG